MSLYDKATLVQIPSGYKASSAKLYSVIPSSGDGDFTVSADADATRINAEGLVETTAANQARLSRNFIDGVLQPDPFLLLEPTRTNLIVRSEEFNLWGDTGVTVTENDTIAPTGAQTADLLTSSANNWRRSISVSVTNGGGYVFSCFVKKHTTTNKIRFEIYRGSSATNLDFEFSTETLSASDANLTDLKVENYPNDWYRVSCKFAANGTNAIVYAYPSQGYSSSGSAYFWGAQLEQGADFPTSYIPTSGSAVTRTEDSCKLQPFSDLPTDYPFTVYGKIEIQEKFAHFISIGNSTNEFKYLSISTGTGGVSVSRRNTPNDADFYTFSYSIGDIIKFAIKYTSNTAYKLYINGSLIGNVTSGDNVDFDFDSVLLGQLRNSDTLRNSVYEAMIFNEALSDNELETLTSYNSFAQMAKGLLYTIE